MAHAGRHIDIADLSAGLQSLLAYQSGTPQQSPTPALNKIGHVLSTSLADAQKKNAVSGWVILVTCTMATTNSLAIGDVYRWATRQDPEDASTRRVLAETVDRAALMREAILKSMLFIGAPRTILSMGRLHEALEEDVKDALRKNSLRMLTPENVNGFIARGNTLGDSIYGSHWHSGAMRARMACYHPDLTDSIIQLYGIVYSSFPDEDAVQGNLSRALNSVVAVACLRAQGGVGELFNGHVRGLLRARDVPGLSEEDYWLASDEGAEWVIRTVDAILDALKP